MSLQFYAPIPPTGSAPFQAYRASSRQRGSVASNGFGGSGSSSGAVSRRSSAASATSATSVSSAASAASRMSADQMDNFRSMRGKSGRSTEDLATHMLDDAESLSDRLLDVEASKEIEKRFLDTTGEAYNILITSNNVRLCHLDERGNYRYLHFGSFKSGSASEESPAAVETVSPSAVDAVSPFSEPTTSTIYSSSVDSAENITTSPSSYFLNSSSSSLDIQSSSQSATTYDMRKSSRRSRQQQKQYWHIIDDMSTQHTFIDISPSFVTIYHAEGVWECRRTALGGVHEIRDDTDYDSRLGGFGQRKRRRARVWYLYEDNNESTYGDGSIGPKKELQLCANTPGEKGVHHLAFKSFYHDL